MKTPSVETSRKSPVLTFFSLTPVTPIGSLAPVTSSTALFQITSIISTYLIARSLGTELGFGTFVVLVPLVWLAGMVPISLNGFGLREAALVMLFVPAGMDRPMATATALLMSAVVVIQAAAGGLIMLIPAGKARGSAPDR